MISGEGDVIEPDDGIVAIGSGAPYATAAAKALMAHSELDAVDLVRAAMEITADICIFTNNHFTIESVSMPADAEAPWTRPNRRYSGGRGRAAKKPRTRGRKKEAAIDNGRGCASH